MIEEVYHAQQVSRWPQGCGCLDIFGWQGYSNQISDIDEFIPEHCWIIDSDFLKCVF